MSVDNAARLRTDGEETNQMTWRVSDLALCQQPKSRTFSEGENKQTGESIGDYVEVVVEKFLMCLY